MGLLLSGCNLPKGAGAPFQSSQRQTEIAGILNPSGLPGTEISNVAGTPAAATPTLAPVPEGYLGYVTQQGDTLPALALRFGVLPDEIHAEVSLPEHELLAPGLTLQIPDVLDETLPGAHLFPDSEVVYGPTVGDFDAAEVTRRTRAATWLSTVSSSSKPTC